MDTYMLLLKIPNPRTREAVVSFYDRWSHFYEAVEDAWWDLRLEKHHHPRWRRWDNDDVICSCGAQVGEYENEWPLHLGKARDEMWKRRYGS